MIQKIRNIYGRLRYLKFIKELKKAGLWDKLECLMYEGYWLKISFEILEEQL